MRCLAIIIDELKTKPIEVNMIKREENNSYLIFTICSDVKLREELLNR